MADLLDFGCYQDQGARRQQEDYFATTEPSYETVLSHGGFLAVVADGMGGHSDGALASLTVVNTFLEEYGKKGARESIPEALQRSLLQSNHALLTAIRAKGGNSDMGTTLLACVVQGSQLYWISVGDSRLYRFRQGGLDIISEDHSYGAELDAKLFAGQISAAEAESQASKRHMLTSYLGIERIPKINLSRVPLDLRPGDQLLLCTDGLTNALSDMEILRCLSQPVSAQERCEEIGRRIMDKGDPRQDNVTMVLLETRLQDQAAGATAGGLGSALTKPLIIALAALVAAALVAAYFWLSPLSEDPTAKQPSPAGETEVPAPSKPAAGTVAPTPNEKTTRVDSILDKPVSPETVTAAPSTAPPAPTPQGGQPAAPTITQPGPSAKSAPSTDQPECADEAPKIMTVEQAQKTLFDLGFYRGEIDNDLGPKTQKAIKKFQRRYNLSVTGKLDLPTMKKLREEIGRRTQQKESATPAQKPATTTQASAATQKAKESQASEKPAANEEDLPSDQAGQSVTKQATATTESAVDTTKPHPEVDASVGQADSQTVTTIRPPAPAQTSEIQTTLNTNSVTTSTATVSAEPNEPQEEDQSAETEQEQTRIDESTETQATFIEPSTPPHR